jgi:hypothetical protein
MDLLLVEDMIYAFLIVQIRITILMPIFAALTRIQITLTVQNRHGFDFQEVNKITNLR